MCSLYGFNMCGVRPIFSIDACSFFPQCVLVAITLVEGGAGNGGAGVRARCEWRFPLCSTAIITL